MQNMKTPAPARNNMMASKVAAPTGKSMGTNMDSPVVGAKPGSPIKGFSSGSGGAKAGVTGTTTAGNQPVGKAAGSSVKGFSGGIINGKC